MDLNNYLLTLKHSPFQGRDILPAIRFPVSAVPRAEHK